MLVENLNISIVILLNGAPSKKVTYNDGQKGKTRTLKNHTAKQHLVHVDHLPIIKRNDLFCTYNMLDLVIKLYMPPKNLLEDVGYIFRKESSQPQIAVSFIVVNVFNIVLLLSIFV